MRTLNFLLVVCMTILCICNAQGQTSTMQGDLDKAQNLARQGNITEASKAYMDIMGKYPENRDAVQGWLILNMKRTPTGEEDAIKQLEELEKTYPENTGILFFKAFIQGEYKHYDDALKTNDKLIALRPEDALNWLMRGQILESMERNDEAMKAFEKSTSLDPNNSDAWQNKAGLLSKSGRFDEALESYSRAIQLSPNQPVFIYNRGCVYCRKGDKPNALADLKKAVSMNPQFKSYAVQDRDFESLWEDADFKAIVSQ
ncbi:MAG TPA: tetratricopeptide repeat protein [Bacteroidales bacterium]|nr:tetratricopeptide repeat protein [Bacteroidales bacterium]